MTQPLPFMQLTRILTVGLVAVCVVSARPLAGASKPRLITLEDCIQLALQNNLDIRIQRIAPRIAALTLYDAYSPYDPQASVSLKHQFSSSFQTAFQPGLIFNAPASDNDTFSSTVSGTAPSGLQYGLGLSSLSHTVVSGTEPSSQASVGISLSQPLLKNFWIDSARLNIVLARKSLKESEFDFRLAVMTIINSVEQTYYNLVATRDAVKVQQMALELAQELLKDNKKKVEVGVMAPLDEKQAESQVATSQASLLGAQNAVMIAQDNLKSMLTDKYGDWHDVELEPTEKLIATARVLNRQDSWAKALTMRPEMAKARLEIEKQNVTLRYNRNQLYPELDVTGSFAFSGYGAQYSDALGVISSQEAPSYSFGLSLSMPLTRRDARTKYRMQKETLEQLLLAMKKQERDIMVQVDNAIFTARSTFKQVEATKAAREFAEAALDAERKKLENGKSTNFEVITLQNNLTQSRYAELTALVGYVTALVQLAFNEGATLEDNHVTLEIK